jgi:hypothetical protein
MIQFHEFKTIKNFWIIFQIAIPLLLIIIEISIRYGDSFTIFDFIKTQKLSLIGFVIFMGIFSKVLAERKFINVKKLDMKYKALNFMALCILYALFSLTCYIVLIKIGLTLDEGYYILYGVVSIMSYLVFVIVAFALYMNFLKALIIKNKK